MVSVCLPSDALLQHLPSYLGFSYLGHGISLHGCSSKAQPLLLTLDEAYLLTAAIPDLQRGMAPLGPPVPAQPPPLRLLVPAAGPGLGPGVAPQGHRPWPWARGGFSWPPLISDGECLLLAATGLGLGVAPPGRCPDLRHRVSQHRWLRAGSLSAEGRAELPGVRGQGRWAGGDTRRPRPGAAAGRSHPCPRPGPAAGRSILRA